jgi:hypothetical protein
MVIQCHKRLNFRFIFFRIKSCKSLPISSLCIRHDNVTFRHWWWIWLWRPWFNIYIRFQATRKICYVYLYQMRIISDYYFLRCLVLIFSNVSTVRTSREEEGVIFISLLWWILRQIPFVMFTYALLCMRKYNCVYHLYKIWHK